jgi:hypothetical protein
MVPLSIFKVCYVTTLSVFRLYRVDDKMINECGAEPVTHISKSPLGSTQPLTEMSARNFPGGKGRPAREADNLTAICEPIV